MIDSTLSRPAYGPSGYMPKSEAEEPALKFINLTRRTEIGANSYYLEAGDRRLVLDSGMHPKFDGEKALPNWKALGDPRLQAIIVSHSHQDHICTLRVLMRSPPQARVLSTQPTFGTCHRLFHH